MRPLYTDNGARCSCGSTCWRYTSSDKPADTMIVDAFCWSCHALHYFTAPRSSMVFPHTLSAVHRGESMHLIALVG